MLRGSSCAATIGRKHGTTTRMPLYFMIVVALSASEF